jgi:hypothetical protein
LTVLEDGVYHYTNEDGKDRIFEASNQNATSVQRHVSFSLGEENPRKFGE